MTDQDENTYDTVQRLTGNNVTYQAKGDTKISCPKKSLMTRSISGDQSSQHLVCRSYWFALLPACPLAVGGHSQREIMEL